MITQLITYIICYGNKLKIIHLFTLTYLKHIAFETNLHLIPSIDQHLL